MPLLQLLEHYKVNIYTVDIYKSINSQKIKSKQMQPHQELAEAVMTYRL